MYLLLLMLLAPVELRGQYTCHGKTPQGQYDVVILIEKKDDAYQLTWITNEVKAKGIGVRNGDVLAAFFVNPKNEGGVVLFRITKGGLEGIWSMGSGKVYAETCTLAPASRS